MKLSRFLIESVYGGGLFAIGHQYGLGILELWVCSVMVFTLSLAAAILRDLTSTKR